MQHGKPVIPSDSLEISNSSYLIMFFLLSVNLDFLLYNFYNCKYCRHEPGVLDEPIEIIEDTADMLVVNKPASIPVHPCGRYMFNTLVFILAKEYGYPLENLKRGCYM